MLTLLREQFVNCWVLAKDIEAIAARDGSPEVATLCKRIRENYGYPVDSVLVAPDLSVIGHVNAHDVASAEGYVAFLRKGLASIGRSLPEVAAAEAPKKPDATHRARQLKVTPEQPSTSLLDVVRCLGFGQLSFAYHSIDATAFAEGGVLEVEVRVGRATTGVTFEVCAAVANDDHAVQPVQTKSVDSEGTAKLVHTFKKGDLLGFAVKPGPGSSEGDANAFLATVTVRRP